MARSRLVKPGLAKNEVLAELGPMAQLLFALLPCYADREGRLEDRPKRLKAEIFPYYDADVDSLLQSLADSEERFISRYEVDGKRYIQITNFALHQAPHHKEEASTIQAQPMLDSSTDQPRVKHDNLGCHAPYKDKDKDKDKQQAANNKADFDRFWQAAHLKKGKVAATKAYAAAIARLAGEHDDASAYLLDRMLQFASSPEADPPDREPIHPATWLNQGRYDDDPATWQRRGASSADPRGTAAAVNGFLEARKL